jgi:small subunit ribosomal protein S17
MERQRGVRKTQIGVVVSDKMDKTVVVEVKRLVAHPLYHKIIRRRAKIKAHDAANACQVGDKVLLVETRPLSRDKHWRVKQILEKAQ